MSRLLDTLSSVNPVPDAAELADSDAAAELAMRRPGSVLDWRISGEDYLADGYRVRLVEPRKWEITCQGGLIAYHHSRKGAFRTVEDHCREAIRRRDLIRLALIFVLATATWVGAGLVAEELLWGALPVYFFLALSSLIRFFAVFSRNLIDPYRRRLAWEKRPWRERLFFGRR